MDKETRKLLEVLQEEIDVIMKMIIKIDKKIKIITKFLTK